MAAGGLARGTAFPREVPRTAAGAPPLPWPAAALTIGVLSAGLWGGLAWLVATLF